MEVNSISERKFIYADSILNVVYQELQKIGLLIQSDEYYESYCSDMKSLLYLVKGLDKTRNADSGFTLQQYLEARFETVVVMEQKTLQ